MQNTTLENILLSRRYLISTSDQAVANNTYLNAYLLVNFGIEVDKPELLTKEMVEQISDKFHLNVPKSFYINPQDTKLFSCDELLLEQLVSYFAYGSDLGRVELFKKVLPTYVVGDEIKLRTFYIVSAEEAEELLIKLTENYCAYTRPFSLEELDEFMVLYTNHFYHETEIACKDNIFALLPYDETFARFLDKKDIVKLSIKRFGDSANFSRLSKKDIETSFADIVKYIPYVKSCPMSKKQAKYFNKIVSLCGLKLPKETNKYSPDQRALKLLAAGDVVGAAKIYADSGSMLERRIKMLISRATLNEALEIINMLPAVNPVVLHQLMSTIASDSDVRTFRFFRNNKVRVHQETPYEAMHRKTKLPQVTRDFLANACLNKIKEYYANLPNLGKIYIADNFYTLGVPTNTSASGKGIDVVPTGSRLPCTGNFIRTFVHWKDAFDIDSSLIIVGADDELKTMGWFSYYSKPYGNAILFSGDVTSSNGAEYFDIDLESLAARGCKYVVQTFHGYCDTLDHGEIYAGYQNKENLSTTAWDPKNIEMQFRVKGESRGCIAFAIDIQTREIIILNQIIESDERIVNPAGFKTIERYLQPSYLTVNVGLIAECRGVRVADPAEADVVFDDTYIPENTEENTQQIIRSYELEKLVAFVNN